MPVLCYWIVLSSWFYKLVVIIFINLGHISIMGVKIAMEIRGSVFIIPTKENNNPFIKTFKNSAILFHFPLFS